MSTLKQLLPTRAAKISNELISGYWARELHAFLESRQDFTTWIKARIKKYGFIDGADFTLHKIVERKAITHQYYITPDMAKELAMVENNEKGRQARRYFIECEKQLIKDREALANQQIERLKEALVNQNQYLEEKLFTANYFTERRGEVLRDYELLLESFENTIHEQRKRITHLMKIYIEVNEENRAFRKRNAFRGLLLPC